MDVHVLNVDWLSHREALQAIRGDVFIREQGVPRDIEWDGQDEDSHHFLAINEAGQRIGCGRLLPSGQIGRMAVLPSERGRGIGRQILDAAIDKAGELGFERVFLHAQSAVVDFYRKAGFLPEGGEFLEAGIPHQAMSLVLPIPYRPPAEAVRPQIREQEVPAAATGAELLQYAGESDCVEGLLSTLQQPVRTVRIYSQELDQILFDRADVVGVLSAFVRRGPPARLMVLIHSSSGIVSHGHRLVELARRLDSKIAIRTVPGELAVDRHSYIITDEQGFFLLPDYREHQALANRWDPAQAKKLADRFDYLWERSETDPELRVLRL